MRAAACERATSREGLPASRARARPWRGGQRARRHRGRLEDRELMSVGAPRPATAQVTDLGEPGQGGGAGVVELHAQAAAPQQYGDPTLTANRSMRVGAPGERAPGPVPGSAPVAGDHDGAHGASSARSARQRGQAATGTSVCSPAAWSAAHARQLPTRSNCPWSGQGAADRRAASDRRSRTARHTSAAKPGTATRRPTPDRSEDRSARAMHSSRASSEAPTARSA